MIKKGAETFIDWCNALFNSLSILFFLPVIIMCYLYRIVYLLCNFTFDFDMGLEVTYNFSLCIYIIFIISLIFGAIV